MTEALPAELVGALRRETDCYRQLLALARTRHCLLRQGRWLGAARMAAREADLSVRLHTLEQVRSQLVAEHRTLEISRDMQVMNQQRTSLVRRLRPVVRANQALETRWVLPRLAIAQGVEMSAARFRLRGVTQQTLTISMRGGRTS